MKTHPIPTLESWLPIVEGYLIGAAFITNCRKSNIVFEWRARCRLEIAQLVGDDNRSLVYFKRNLDYDNARMAFNMELREVDNIDRKDAMANDKTYMQVRFG